MNAIVKVLPCVLFVVLAAGCVSKPERIPTRATTGKGCDDAYSCVVAGQLKMSSDGHGYIGELYFEDGTCINVSVPDRRSKWLMGEPAQEVELVGRVLHFPSGEDLAYFTVDGRRIGLGLCNDYYVFVR